MSQGMETVSIPVLIVCLGYEENAYIEIKTLIADFLDQNRVLFDNIFDIDHLIPQIRKKYVPATYEIIYLAA